jgi:flagellar hook-length control protein FliK
MDISLSQTIFAANIATASNPLNFISAEQIQNSAEMASNANAGETETTDNIQIIVQNESLKPLESFSGALAKKMTVKISPDDLTDENTQEQVQTPAEFVIPQELLTLSLTPDIVPDVKIENPLSQIAESQISNDSVQPITDIEAVQSPVVQIAEPAPVPTNLENEAVQTATESKQIESEAIIPDMPVDEKPAPINNPASVPLNTAEPTPSVETVITSMPVSNPQDNNEAEPQTPTGNIEPKIPAVKPDMTGGTENQNQQNIAQITEKPVVDKDETAPANHRVKAEHFEPFENNKIPVETISIKTVEQKISQLNTQPDTVEDEINDDLQPASTAKEPLTDNIAQPVVSQQPSTTSASVKTETDSDTAVSIRNQIQESIYTSFRSDSKEIVVRLNPPELGKVAIKFSEQNNAITGLLQVDNLETKNSIQQSLPEIIQNLNDGGVLVKKIEVVLTSQQEQYMPKEHSATGQQNWAEHQNAPNHESQRNNGFYGESFRYAESSAELMETQGLLTDNYINVLV